LYIYYTVMSLIYNAFKYVFGSKHNAVEEPTLSSSPSNHVSTEHVANLFYNAKRNTPDAELHKLANAAANESLLYTLKTIAYIRNVRGERDLGRRLYEWLQKTHEKQLIENMPLFLNKYGRYDDFIYLPRKSKALYEYLKHLGEQLVADLENMALGKPVSLAAKWVPSETSAVNKKTALTFRLARAMKIPISDLRKKYLTPLRSYIGIVEQKMCSKSWKDIDYSKLPEHAFKRNIKAFEENDKERFEEYTKNFVKPKKQLRFPHEMIDLSYHSDPKETFEANWTASVKRLEKTVVMNDFSPALHGLPFYVSLSLGLIASRVISFESVPQFVNLNPESVDENIRTMLNVKKEESTNICEALKLIMENMKDAMPEKLIIVGCKSLSKTDSLYNEAAQTTMMKMFEDAGLKMPSIVFWNVDSPTIEFGEAFSMTTVSGYSDDILQCILNNELPTAFNTMMNALNNEKFADIREKV